MVTLNIHRSSLLALVVIAAFCLLSLSISGIAARDQSPFAEVASEDINYDKVYETELVKNGSKVFIEIVLTKFPKEVKDLSHLYFYSDLGVYPAIFVDGVSQMYKIPFDINHQNVNEVKVTISGTAPDVYKRTENFTLLNITQRIGTQEEEYLVIDIKRDISSEIIEDAIAAVVTADTEIKKAQEAITNATEAGVNVADAEKTFALANEHLNNSQSLYNEGRPEQALAEAQLAIDSAKEAKGEAEAAIGGKTKGNITLIAAVVVLAVVAFLVLTKKRRKKRKIY